MVSDERTSGPGDRSDPLVGQIVANYRVLRRLGQGGMGAVYLAQHTILGRHAAVKVLLPEFSNNRELVGRFLNEARATAQLRHRGFVEIFDSGTLGNGSAYLVMEYLRGANFAAAIEWRKTVAWKEAHAVLREVAASVAHSHKHGIVHRDLKPDNVFLAVADEAEPGTDRLRTTVKVLDFGIAKLTAASGSAGGSARTRTGSLLGTPLYMSPEQCRGAGHIDHRTDIYSLGCIAYHALTGQPPFPLEGFGEIISAHLNTPPLPLRVQSASVTEPVEAFVLSLLAKDPAARPQTMDAVVVMLDQLGDARGEGDLFSLIPPHALTGEAPPPTLASSPGPRVATTPMSNSFFRGSPTPTPAGQSGGTRRLPVATTGGGPAPFSTFGGAASELVPRSPAGRSGARRAIGVAVAVIALAGVAVAWLVTSGRGDQTARVRHPDGIAPAETQQAAQPAHEDVAPPAASAVPDVKPAPDPPRPTVTVRIQSVPAGAEVIDAKSRRVLGLTPFEAALPRAAGEAGLILRKRGFQAKRITIDMARNTETTATLDRHSHAGTSTPDESDEDRRKL